MTPSALLGEAQQLGLPLDMDAERFEPLDQELLVLVLRKDLHERVGRQPLADVFERDAGLSLALDPEISGGHAMTLAQRPHP